MDATGNHSNNSCDCNCNRDTATATTAATATDIDFEGHGRVACACHCGCDCCDCCSVEPSVGCAASTALSALAGRRTAASRSARSRCRHGFGNSHSQSRGRRIRSATIAAIVVVTVLISCIQTVEAFTAMLPGARQHLLRRLFHNGRPFDSHIQAQALTQGNRRLPCGRQLTSYTPFSFDGRFRAVRHRWLSIPTPTSVSKLPVTSSLSLKPSSSALSSVSTSATAVASSEDLVLDHQTNATSTAISTTATATATETTAATSLSAPAGATIVPSQSSKATTKAEKAKQQKQQQSHAVTNLLEGLTSRPKPGGNWDVEAPLAWTERFGRRSHEYETELETKVRLKPGDEGYFDVADMRVDGVTIVRTKDQARKVMEVLMNADPNIFHACDTEVMDIDLKQVGPVGNGYVTCASVYSGPDFDYGLGDGPGTMLWIDNLDDACGILQEFKPWFEDHTKLKVWHNYGFDRHVMWNEGINCVGFGGDTMHMARLEDTSRQMDGRGGYSLEALTTDLLEYKKTAMKEIFGVPRMRKDGSEGTIRDIPPIEVMQRDPTHREKFIEYSAIDAKSTWDLHEVLVGKLKEKKWIAKGPDLYAYYWNNMREFGSVLTDMERRGIRVNAKDYLATVEVQARKDRDEHSNNFRQWAAKMIGPDGLALNPSSATQLATFLFGGSENAKSKEKSPKEREFKVPYEEIPDDALEALKLKQDSKVQKAKEEEAASSENDFANDILDEMKTADLKKVCKEQGLKVSGTKGALKQRLREHFAALTKAQVAATDANNNDGNAQTVATAAGIPAAGSAQPDADFIDLDKLIVKELKALCKTHNLKVSGKKAELQARLREIGVGVVDATGTDTVETTLPVSGGEDYATMSDDMLRTVIKGRNLPTNLSRDEMIQALAADCDFMTELICEAPKSGEKAYTSIAEAMDSIAKKSATVQEILDTLKLEKAKQKYIDVTIRSVGMQPVKYTAGGAPSVTADALKELAGDPHADPPKYGTAYEYFGKGKEGHEACVALHSLCALGSIDTMIANFFTSLQTLTDHQSRVHCSMNLNTETGRLSSRRPNLQNQPALEKDKYKIRKAFESSPGNNLIVADYGQLELRLLASMTRCKSMITAFQSGGDFHSRTAMDMFDYVKKKLDDGEVLLEWDYSKGDPPKPLLKDEFASERRKAKTLNFSIAYGKTAHGLSQDWGVSQKEAEEMLQKWYAARPEVQEWQAKTKAYARQYGITRTLMGRYRQLPHAQGPNRRLISAGERASINTPIQGGAADVAMMAMNKINRSEKLRRLGWILLLQIHDEVILEGPEETAEEAFAEVIHCMQEPWVLGLAKTAVPLLVDGSYTYNTWYDAK